MGKNLLRRSSRQGFTIIELLIVIVVIAILAAISIVAFRGIQDRTRASQVLSSVDSFEKVLRLYSAANGRFPITYHSSGSLVPGGAPYACLGTAADYPAATNFAYGACYSSGGGTAAAVYPALATALAPFSSNLKLDPATNSVDMGGGAYVRGLLYISYDLPGSTVTQIVYIQKGNQGCGRGTKDYTPPDSSVPTLPSGATTCTVVLSAT